MFWNWLEVPVLKIAGYSVLKTWAKPNPKVLALLSLSMSQMIAAVS